MADIKAPRGVRDILPEESWKWSYVLKIAAEVAKNFGYSEVHLPVFEHTELFSRGIGETTDVVEKEMYTLKIEVVAVSPFGQKRQHQWFAVI